MTTNTTTSPRTTMKTLKVDDFCILVLTVNCKTSSQEIHRRFTLGKDNSKRLGRKILIS